MQQTCPKCGFQTETTAKFCRQCGAHLFNDSSGSEAQTQQYGRQTPAPPVSDAAATPFTSQMPPSPPSIADTFAPDTGRLRNPQPPAGPPPMGGQYAPSAYPAPAYGQPPMPVAAKSNWWKWALGVVLSSVLVCGGCVTFGIYKAQQAAQGLPAKVNEAIEQAKREAERAAREATQDGANQQPQYGPDGKPLPPPPPPPPGSETASVELSKLKYPGAKQTNHVKAMGQEVINQTSDAPWENIKTFYEKEMGSPMAETEDENGKNLVYRKGKTMVTIQPARAATGKTEITIINSSFLDMLGK